MAKIFARAIFFNSVEDRICVQTGPNRDYERPISRDRQSWSGPFERDIDINRDRDIDMDIPGGGRERYRYQKREQERFESKLPD